MIRFQAIAAASPGIYVSDVEASGANLPTIKSGHTAEVRVLNQAPIAQGGGPYAVREGESLTLSALGSSDHNDSIVSYGWDLDDDGLYDDAVGITTEVVFETSGILTVGLKVTDEFDASDTDTLLVYVFNGDPLDTTPPVITLNGDNPLTLIQFSGPYIEPGATVTDDVDPAPTLMIIGGDAVNTHLPNGVFGGGPFTIVYGAFDASGNTAQVITRTINVIEVAKQPSR